MVAGERSRAPQHAMTGHDERDRILAHRGADGARGRWLADSAGDVRIGGRAAHRHAEQRLPDPKLEIRADQDDAQRRVGSPERGIEGAARIRGGQALVLDEPGARPAPRHVGARGLAIPVVDETETRHAARRRDHDRLAEGRGMEAVSERQIVAPIVARSQRLVGDEQVMQPARAGKADVIGRVEHARRVAQEFPRALDGDGLQERLRRQPRPALENVLEVRSRKADMVGDRLDRRLIAIAPGDELDRALDDGVIGAGGRSAGNVEHAVRRILSAAEIAGADDDD